MTERSTAKMKRADDLKSPRKGAGDDTLRAELARLRIELATAQQRVADLEQRTGDALVRIDQALDSLHNLCKSE